MRCFLLSSLVVLAPVLAHAIEDEPPRPTICLNMIVKNESAVITRCLDSVKSMIDYWVIVDTGSTDGTQEIVTSYLKDIPGELHERPWRNFGENRTEALRLAQGRADYLLFMDADDVLELDEGVSFPLLTEDLYNMWRGVPGFTYHKPQLVRSDLPWKWVGVTHEYLDCGAPYSSRLLTGVRYVSKDDGASSKDTGKFLKNVQLLEEGLKVEPTNERYAFYLAESYRDAGNPMKALEWYQKRVLMGGWAEEIFWSKLQIAHLLRGMELPLRIVAEAYLDAHFFRPHRAEPVYYLAELMNEKGNYGFAYAYLTMHARLPKPPEKDWLFNMDWIEEYGLLFQLSIATYYVGKYEESLDACTRLIAMQNLPDSWRRQAISNSVFPLKHLQNSSQWWLARLVETPTLMAAQQWPSNR